MNTNRKKYKRFINALAADFMNNNFALIKEIANRHNVEILECLKYSMEITIYLTIKCTSENAKKFDDEMLSKVGWDKRDYNNRSLY